MKQAPQIRLGRALCAGILLVLLSLSSASRAATLQWTNTAGGGWSAATNWSPNQVPGTADTVWITNAGSYTVTSSATVALAGLVLGEAGGSGTQTLVLNAGTLTVTNAVSLANGVVGLNGGSLVTAGAANLAGVLNQSSGVWQLKSAATLGTYNLTNGELRGGTLTVTNFNWINGNLNADLNGDKTIIPAGGVLNLTGAAARHMSYYSTQGRGLDNYGTWNWSGDCILYGRNGGIVNNYGTVNVTGAGSAQYSYWSGDTLAPAWNNYGTFSKSAGSGIFYFNSVYLNNSGAMTASNGTLSLYGSVVNSSGSLNATGTKLQFYNATVTNTGPVSVGPGTLLTVDAGGTVVFAPQSSLVVPTANAWQIVAGTMQLRTTNVQAPSVWVSGGTLWHQTNNTLPVVNQSSGTWRLSASTTVSSYNLTNGELRGGTLTVTNFLWANGDLNADVNGDKTIIPVGGVLNLTGTGTRHLSYYGSQGRGLDNYGTWNWTGDCVLYGRNGGIVNNYGTVNALNSGIAQLAYWSGDALAPTLNNYGTFTKSPGTGIFYFSSIYANNFGLLDLQSGRLSINNSILTNRAAIHLSAAAFLTFDAGNSSAFLPGSSLNSPAADHVIFNAPTVYLQTTNITTPSFWVAGGTVYQQTNNVVPTINQSGGTWRLALAATLGTYNLTNGELRGGTLTVTNFNWMTGDLNADANTDRTVIPAGGVLTLSGTAARHMSYWPPATKGRGLDNHGTWNWTGDCVLYGRNGGIVNNYGTLNLLHSASTQFAYWSGDALAPTLNNFGTLTKSPGLGIFYLTSVYVNNTGLMSLQTGRLSINNSILTNSAAIHLSASAFLTFDAGNSSAFLPGSALVSPTPDHVIFNAAAVYLQTTNVTTPSLLIAGGTLWQQTPNVVPTINQSAGTWRLTLPTTVNTYNLTNGTLRGGTLTATNFNWTEGNLYADTNGDRVIIPAGGVLNLLGAGEKWLYYNAPATQGYGIDNLGTWNWSGACMLRGFNSTVNNAGTVTVGTGAGTAYYGYYPGYLSPTWNNPGVFSKPTGAGIFQFYGAYLNSSGLLDAQAGTLSLSSSTTTNSAAVTLGASALLQNDTSSETTFLPGSSLNAPAANSVRVNSGTVYLQTTNVTTPALLIAGGTLYQQARNVVSTINESAGVWRLALPTSVGTYNLTNGTLRGGTLTATNFNWTEGNLYADANGDRVTIPAGGVFNLLGVGEKWLYYNAPATQGYGIDNLGTWNWSGACMLRGFNSTVNNGGSVTVGTGAGTAYYGYYPGYLSPTWNNTGVLSKPTGAGIFQFYGAYLNNSGLLDAQAGTLSLSSSTTTNSAAVTLGASALLQNDTSSETTFLPGSSLSALAANAVRVNSGTVYLQTTNVTTPALLIAGGTLYQQAQNVVSTINESAGVWRLALPTTVGTYNLTNGTLRGGTLTATNFNWTDGGLYAETNGDRLIIPATGTFKLLGAGEKSLFYYAPATQGYGIDNYGSWNWSGACMLRGFNSTVNNAGTVTVGTGTGTAYYSYYPGYPSPTWNNTGVFSKPTGAGIFQFYGAYLNNFGLLDAQAGTLSLYAGTTTNSAAVTIGASALLQNDTSSETTFLPGSSLSAPAANSVRVISGTVYLQTTNVTTPALLIAGGTLYQQAQNVVSTINESAGVWRLALPTTVGTYNLTNGTLRGGTLTATNFNWTDGGLYAETNGDRLIIPATGTFKLLGAGEKSLFYYAPATQGYGIDNYGSWNWSGACMLRGFNSTVNNAGTVTVGTGTGTAYYSYYPGYPSPTWNNTGVFSKPTGAAIFQFYGAYLNNSGLLEAQAGSLSLYAGTTTNSGAVTLGASALLQNDNSAETTFLPGSSLNASAGNSLRVNSGTVYLQTTNVTTPALLIAGGTLYQQAQNVVPTINESSGVWRLALATSVRTYNLTNGTLRGGTLTATNFNWTDGGLYAETNGDRLIIPATGTLNLLGAGEKSLFYYAPATKGYGIDNYGTWNWSGACVLRGFNSTVNNAGTVTVNPGAVTASYSYYPGYLEPVWNNLGSFSKPSNSNTFNFTSATVTNSGTLTSAGGTMRFGGNYVQTGGSASLGTNFIADAAVRVEAGSFTGRGFVAGQLYNADSLNPGASPGFITAASFTNTASGTYHVELGGLSGGTNYDQLRIAGTATLTGLVQVAFVNGFTPVVGNSFTVMTYSARSGAFKDVQAPVGYTFQQVYTATNLILNAVAFSNVPPVITLQPSNRSVFAGTTVRFDVAATGTDPLNYQWKFGGNPIPGATNTSFTLLSAQATNQGNYAVDVSNLGGFAYSSNALLTVLPGFNFAPAFNLPISLPWNSASLQNSRVGYIAGPNGTVLVTRNGGASWTSIGPGVPNTLYSVQVIDGAIFVFGSGGHICVSYDGGLTWKLFATGTTETFRNAHLTGLTTGWAVGSGGTIYQFTNGIWGPQPSGSGASFYGVWSYGGSAWAVGSGGSICRWNGTWTCGNYGGYTFYGVGFWPGGIHGLAVGGGGTIYRTGDGGNSWYPVASGTTADLYSVTLTRYGGVDYAWIGGAGGTLLFSSNGGGGWSGLGSGTTANITSVVFRDGYGLYCADDGSCRHFSFAPIGVNLPPAVALVNGTNLITNALMRVTNVVCVPFRQSAVALDPDGVVTNMSFTVAAAATTNFFAPRTYPRYPDTYSFTWYNDVLGTFTIRAIAQDDRGAEAVSEPITVAVVPADLHYLIMGGLLTNGACKLCMFGITNNTYEVLANSNLLTTNWISIGLMENTNGFWRYSDAQATNYNYRFYRAHQVP